ncbi:fibroblast growth factor 20-like protein [Lates japonicus]|uniref:Fibroblast growth factor 20-like protein n=1 Tax=Lates japonicus TaxID=270547 RepID=A0AAD3R2Y1_LATJO|nr:fibroblast growth factor 20-like protein [Lates japonicus]
MHIRSKGYPEAAPSPAQLARVSAHLGSTSDRRLLQAGSGVFICDGAAAEGMGFASGFLDGFGRRCRSGSVSSHFVLYPAGAVDYNSVTRTDDGTGAAARSTVSWREAVQEPQRTSAI